MSIIKQARESLGMTQQELGEAVGLTPKWAQSVVAGWERGERPIPRKRLKAAARVLGVDIGEIV